MASPAMNPLAQSFDPGVLGALFDHEPGVIAVVLLTFCDSMAAHLQQLQAAVAQGDMALVAAVSHRIKGAARMSGALALAQASEQLEHAASSACSDRVDPVWAELWRQWEGLHLDPGFCQARRAATVA